MSTFAKARRAAFVPLLLGIWVVAATAPAGAAQVAPLPGGPPGHPVIGSAASAGPSVAFWLLVGCVAVLAATVLAMAAAWRHERSHRTALSS